MHRGKVRDSYIVDDDYLLIVTTDRLSAFDVILNEGIPSKGCILNQMSQFWFNFFAPIIPNHLTSIDVASVVTANEYESIKGRAMVVKRAKPILIEAVVRGYLAGSAWHSYQMNSEICGVSLPFGLSMGERLTDPIFTPAAKAAVGEHDENISYIEMEKTIGAALSEKIKHYSLAIYIAAAKHAKQRQIIIADTKFEFGLDKHNELILIDEVLTPDSSRFWAAEDYQLGQTISSFDKQIVRDWLAQQPWNRCPPAPSLPPEIISATAARYNQVKDRLILSL